VALVCLALLVAPTAARLFGTGGSGGLRQQPGHGARVAERQVLQTGTGGYDYYEENEEGDESKGGEEQWMVDLDNDNLIQNEVGGTEGTYEEAVPPEEYAGHTQDAKNEAEDEQHVTQEVVEAGGDWRDEQEEDGNEEEVYGAADEEVGGEEEDQGGNDGGEEWQEDAEVENEEQEWQEEYEEAKHDLEEFHEDAPAAGAVQAAADATGDASDGEEEEEEDISRPSAVLDLTDGREAGEDTWENAVEDDGDWVLTLANALRNGDEDSMERAINLAVGAGEASAVSEVVREARDMENGGMLTSAWGKIRERMGEAPEEDTGLEMELEAAEKMEVEAENMGEEAEEYMGEAETMKLGAEDLEAQAGSITGDAGEYDRLEVTDELGEAAEALDGEATKLELEAAKLRAEAAKLEQQANAIESKVIGQGEDGEASWLSKEAAYLKEEAAKLVAEAEELKREANNLDGQADRIDRIEAENLERVERERQARIDQDLDQEEDFNEEYNFDEENIPRHGIKAPLSHSALVDRFKNLLHA